jgi:hypothetical protein
MSHTSILDKIRPLFVNPPLAPLQREGVFSIELAPRQSNAETPNRTYQSFLGPVKIARKATSIASAS